MPKLKPPREAVLIAQIKGLLNGYGLYWKRINAGLIANPKGRFYRSAPAGTPDFYVCLAGKFIAIEAKRKGGKQSQFQKLDQADLERNKGLYWLIDDLDILISKINEIKTHAHPS